MDKNRFYNKIRSILQKKLGTDYQLSIETHEPMDYIIIKQTPFHNVQCIPLADFYEDFCSGYSILAICDEIINIYRAVNCPDDIDKVIPYEYDAIKNKLFPRIISLYKNKELLVKVPCIEFSDLGLLLVFCVELDCMDHTTIRFMVTNCQLSIWNISKEELIQSALSNI